jgi:hypothetical protein
MAPGFNEHEERLHDLEAMHAGFKGLIALVRAGHRFDDAEGERALAQLERSLEALRAEIRRVAEGR